MAPPPSRHGLDIVRLAAELVAVVESCDDAIISKDLEGTIRSWNGGAERLFGYTAEEAIGQRVTMLISPERADEEPEILARLRRGERVDHFETVRIAKDGRRIDVSLTISPVRDATGQIVGASKVARDISDRVRADVQLRAMIDALPIAVYTTDAMGRVDHFNAAAAEFSGRVPDLGRDRWCVAWKLSHTDGRAMPHDEYPMATALKEGRAIRGVEAIAELPDGTRRWFEAFPTPLFDSNGALVGGIDMMIDTTERRRTEAALREADHHKSEFLETLAHELRNPLAALTHAVELMMSGPGDTASAEETGLLMHRQLAQMTRLVDDLRDLSRIDQGKLELVRAPADLAQIVQLAVESAGAAVEHEGHELKVELPRDPVRVDGDAARLVQVFSNLLSNAAKFTEPGGHILVRVGRRGNEATVSVRDDGRGIPSELLPRIFDRFAQGDPATDRSRAGLGIGLTLVRQLVERHGGHVNARSDGPGAGSEFVVHLPTSATPIAETPRDDPIGPRARVEAKRVVVVDDQQDNADSLSMLLERMGHEPRVCYSGFQAVDLVAAFEPHVVLLDIGLPDVDGCEVARRIREQLPNANTLLVALTGRGEEKDRQRADEAGFDRYLLKPVDRDVLVALLDEPHGLAAPG